MTIGGAVLVLVAIAALTAGGRAGFWLADRIGLEHQYVFVWSWLRWPVTALVIMLCAALAYYVLPDVKQKFKFITPGSVLGTLVWLLGTWGFSVYAAHFGSYNVTYGSIGGVIVLLTWFYISGFIFLMGGEMNAIIEHASPEGKTAARARRARRRRPRASARARFRPARPTARRPRRVEGRHPAGGTGGASMNRGSLPRWLRRLVIASAIVVGVVVAIRLLLDPVATHFTRKALNDAEASAATFTASTSRCFRPATRSSASRSSSTRGRLEAPAVLRRAGRRAARLARAASRPGGGQRAARRAEAGVHQQKRRRRCAFPTCGTRWSGLMPARINRVEVRDGEVLYRDLTAPRDPQIWVHEIELAVENLATRRSWRAAGRSRSSGSAKLGRSGDVTMFVSANRWRRSSSSRARWPSRAGRSRSCST
jgi:hypothetical protein